MGRTEKIQKLFTVIANLSTVEECQELFDDLCTYKEVEKIAGNRLLDMLPKELRDSYEHYVLEDEEALEPFVKAADKLSAHIKCLEEQKAGNTEFDSAARQTWEAMKAMNRPELDWFLENCLGAFSLNLDQL